MVTGGKGNAVESKTPANPDWFSDVRQVLGITQASGGRLPRPFIGPERAAFYISAIAHPEDTRIALARVRDVLCSALGVAFASRRAESGSTQHYIMEALLPGGLVIAVVANGRHIAEDDDVTVVAA